MKKSKKTQKELSLEEMTDILTGGDEFITHDEFNIMLEEAEGKQ